jgi:hypothetical protein
VSTATRILNSGSNCHPNSTSVTGAAIQSNISFRSSSVKMIETVNNSLLLSEYFSFDRTKPPKKREITIMGI